MSEHGLGLKDVVSEVISVWGIDRICVAPDFAINRAINDINAALQLVWNRADENSYWSRSTIEVELGVREDSFMLPDTVQNVIGPCRMEADRRELCPTETLAELEGFSSLFLDGQLPDAPVAYHIDRKRQSTGDVAGCRLVVTPAPEEGASLLLDVVLEAPRFTVYDIEENPLMPIPHHYVETMLVPIARYRATTFHLFNQEERREGLQTEAMVALQALGVGDPSPVSKEKNKEVAA
jgi:hypothetical protein